MDRQHRTPTRARRPLPGLRGLPGLSRLPGRRGRYGLLATIAVAALVLGACSSADDDGDADADADQGSTPSTEDEQMSAPRLGPPDAGSLPLPAIEGPVTGGEGAPVLGPPGFDLASVGYTEEEYFLSGDATSYTSAEPLGEDGEWGGRAGHQRAVHHTGAGAAADRPGGLRRHGGAGVVERVGRPRRQSGLELHAQRDHPTRIGLGRGVGPAGRDRGWRQPRSAPHWR